MASYEDLEIFFTDHMISENRGGCDHFQLSVS
jgi:hypothetical protein